MCEAHRRSRASHQSRRTAAEEKLDGDAAADVEGAERALEAARKAAKGAAVAETAVRRKYEAAEEAVRRATRAVDEAQRQADHAQGAAFDARGGGGGGGGGGAGTGRAGASSSGRERTVAPPADKFRQLVSPIMSALTDASAHGWLNELAFATDSAYKLPLHTVLRHALQRVVVVPTRRDGMALLAALRTNGVAGRLECDVLDELTPNGRGNGNGKNNGKSSGSFGGGGTNDDTRQFRPLLECVEVVDPRFKPVLEKRLCNWYVLQGLGGQHDVG